MRHLAKMLLIPLGLLLALGVYGNLQLGRTLSVGDNPYYEVQPGSSLNSVINDLSARSVVTIPRIIFRVYGLLTRYQGTIKAGEYELTETLNARTVLRLFRQGNVLRRNITFPEGWDFAAWRAHLKANEFIKQTIADTPEIELMNRLGSNTGYAEGQFFPDTYFFIRGTTDLTILQRANSRMMEVLGQEWENRDVATILDSPAEALVLASIIEKETGSVVDRGYIASVFTNRLVQGMKLQSDPTVIYGLEGFDGDLKRSHLRAFSPYNTYIVTGLPPTPICNPGLASIRASLHPVSSDYFYFVARGDGTSAFSATLAEHNAAVTRFQKAARVKDYRSSPQN